LFFATAEPTRNPHPKTMRMWDNAPRHGAKNAATEEKVMHRQMRITIEIIMAQQQQQQIKRTIPIAIPAVGFTGLVPLTWKRFIKLGAGSGWKLLVACFLVVSEETMPSAAIITKTIRDCLMLEIMK
jgi:hypothetical protein